MSLTIVSLFSGVGGIDLAGERVGMATRLLCEIDKYARTVLAHHFPHAHLHHDITELTADDLRASGAVPDRTVLCAGFPCQDLSVAGGRKGMGEGTRSGLYWHIVRLLADFPARWVVLENVPGLLSSQGGRDMGAVVGSLADLGYGYAWRVLDAQHFGVPQRRRRVVIVGHLGAPWAAPAEVLLEPEGSGRDSAARIPARPVPAADAARGVVAALTSSGVGTCGPDDNQAQAGHLIVQPLALRGRDGGSALEVGEEGGPYNALRAGDGGSSRQSLVAITTLGDRTHALTAEGHDASEDGAGRGTPIVAATLTAGTSAPNVNPPGRRQEDDHNLVAFDPKAGGDATSSGAFEDGTGITPTLGGSRPHAVASETEVRRLTPMECERLQGHPDGWTDVDGMSDSQRYKQMGNGVAVPVFEWVLGRVAATDARLRGEAA